MLCCDWDIEGPATATDDKTSNKPRSSSGLTRQGHNIDLQYRFRLISLPSVMMDLKFFRAVLLTLRGSGIMKGNAKQLMISAASSSYAVE